MKVRGDFLPRKRLLSDAEIDRLVRAFVDLGVAKIRITGGEPLRVFFQVRESICGRY